MNIIGLLFLVSGSMFFPYGISMAKFDTKEECYEYYASLKGFKYIEERRNFYDSNDIIVVYSTSFGQIFLTCKEMEE